MRTICFSMVTLEEISQWCKDRTEDEQFSVLDQRLFDRAKEYVADKNEKFLQNLSLACYGEKYQVTFSAGVKNIRILLMVKGSEIHGEVLGSQSIRINCGELVRPDHIYQYRNCCPNDCKMDRLLLQEAAKFLSHNIPSNDKLNGVRLFKCYGSHVNLEFQAKLGNTSVSAHVVGDKIVVGNIL